MVRIKIKNYAKTLTNPGNPNDLIDEALKYLYMPGAAGMVEAIFEYSSWVTLFILDFKKYNDFEKLIKKYPAVDFTYFQSNIEGELINEIQRAGFSSDGIIINPGGYTHTSVAIGDAIAAITAPVAEVHISNIFARDEFRKLSYVSGKAAGVISGFGMKGYELAVEYFMNR